MRADDGLPDIDDPWLAVVPENVVFREVLMDDITGLPANCKNLE